jgi:hypothetical protein
VIKVKRIGLTFWVSAVMVILFRSPAWAWDFQEGDILFQAMNTSQSLALVMATGSEFTHCGIVFKSGDKFYVYEAVGATVMTPIEKFIERSQGPVVQTRLRDPSILTPEALVNMKKVGAVFDHKLYDFHFMWSDDRIYCSELVYKIYERGLGLELTPLKHFRDYNLRHPAVRALIEKRFKGKGPLEEMNELVVAPVDLLNSVYLEEVARIPGGNGRGQ